METKLLLNSWLRTKYNNIDQMEHLLTSCSIEWIQQKFFFPHTDISASLAPPPLDDTLTVEERLKQIQSCLQKDSSVTVTYDFIHLYKILLLACELAVRGTFEDPKVW